MPDPQMTLAMQTDGGFERHRKPTRRDEFLAQMERVVPWTDLCALIEPVYPKARESGGRPPIGLERMLRIYFLQQWYDLSDPAVEEALYDSQAMRRFVGIDLGREPVPDETTVCKFRHRLEAHDLGRQLFERVWMHLGSERTDGVARHDRGCHDHRRAEFDQEPRQGERDPEMHQTKKGNQWHFGMKAHIGVDSRSKLIHSVVATAANVHDSQVLGDLLHGAETRVWGDSAYTGTGRGAGRGGPEGARLHQREGPTPPSIE
jgi:IS5 family transposase